MAARLAVPVKVCWTSALVVRRREVVFSGVVVASGESGEVGPAEMLAAALVVAPGVGIQESPLALMIQGCWRCLAKLGIPSFFIGVKAVENGHIFYSMLPECIRAACLMAVHTVWIIYALCGHSLFELRPKRGESDGLVVVARLAL